jgi:hypothetical protein
VKRNDQEKPTAKRLMRTVGGEAQQSRKESAKRLGMKN